MVSEQQILVENPISLLHKTKMAEAQPISSPMTSTCKLSKRCNDLFQDPTLYRSVVGALQYATLTRPKISFAVNKVCQFMAKPLDSHWVVKRILRYLKGTLFHGLHMRPAAAGKSLTLTAMCDADWASDIDDRRVQIRLCHLFRAKSDLLVVKETARSSTEAEYRSLAQTSAELTWVQALLQELQVSFSTLALLCDNQSAEAIAHNPVFHSHTKHMEIEVFFCVGETSV